MLEVQCNRKMTAIVAYVAVGHRVRGCSVDMTDELDALLSEFAAAQLIIADSAWLHVRWALCQKHHGQTNEARAGLERAGMAP